jgi:hypothetical protein
MTRHQVGHAHNREEARRIQRKRRLRIVVGDPSLRRLLRDRRAGITRADHLRARFGGCGSRRERPLEKNVFFETAPPGTAFVIHISDEFGRQRNFEFIYTA